MLYAACFVLGFVAAFWLLRPVQLRFARRCPERWDFSQPYYDEFSEIVIDYKNKRMTGYDKDFLVRYIYEEQKCKRYERLLHSEYHTDKAIRHAQHMADIIRRNKEQRRQLSALQRCIESRQAII